MIRVLIILLLTTTISLAECKYTAEGTVENQKIINLKEKYVCEEDKSFFVQFWTTDEWARTATMTFLFVLENL